MKNRNGLVGSGNINNSHTFWSRLLHTSPLSVPIRNWCACSRETLWTWVVSLKSNQPNKQLISTKPLWIQQVHDLEFKCRGGRAVCLSWFDFFFDIPTHLELAQDRTILVEWNMFSRVPWCMWGSATAPCLAHLDLDQDALCLVLADTCFHHCFPGKPQGNLCGGSWHSAVLRRHLFLSLDSFH